MENISVLGAGSWGTALAIVLAENGHRVRIWSHRQDQVDEMNTQHTNAKYLPDTTLPTSLVATASLQQAVNESDIVVVAVPTKAIRSVCQQFVPFMREEKLFVHVSKGIEPDSLKRISELLAEEIPSTLRSDIVVLSGPSHAEEVVLQHPTTVTVACENMRAAERVQDAFMSSYFRVYTLEDVIGAEIGGALKNVIALAAGAVDGLGYGDNAKAALITRGLAEISRLGVKMGANPLTFAGLTGMGDLIVTCTSVHSRNWRAGNLLGKGYKLDEILEQMGMVVEGVRTAKAAHQLAAQYDVAMPISSALYSVLFEETPPKQAVDALMARMKKREIDEMI
ncbi:MAG: NAD(P)H-dependent glycerol-3-phosphate dehydrogenase [Caryophanon sp.]|nr:NAD(P)H-dependent glycerol-3-phosphate dehydrogenase [Caryophanon sp.]